MLVGQKYRQQYAINWVIARCAIDWSKSTFILNMRLVVGAAGGHNCIHAAPEFTESHTGSAEDCFWLFVEHLEPSYGWGKGPVSEAIHLDRHGQEVRK